MKTKVTCFRCGGSGNYSFNLRDGTVCYGCNGSGFQMRDIRRDASNAAKNKKTKDAMLMRCELNRAMYWQVIHDMNPVYGPFDVSTPLGLDRLNCAVARATGKGIAQIRDERVKNAPLK